MNQALTDLQARDLRHVWHPCSQMKDYEAFPPIVIKKGQGVWLYDEHNHRYLDAVSSWWVNLFGHANPRISQALSEQAFTLEHTIFANFTHEPAINLAEKLAALAPQELHKVFFADNGSSAIEVALKMSFQYHMQTGKPAKQRFLALTDAYHGETIGALSVGGVGLYNEVYQPLLLDTVRAKGPDCFRCPFQEEPTSCQAPCSQFVEEQLQAHHEEITAVIIEPLIQAAAGMKMYPPIYLQRLRALCSHYEVHFIADEIAVGFGRTGTLFACEQADITPDFMCLSKGLTGGYLPLSVVLTTDQIYNAFYDDYGTMKAFLHSHSYSGNTLACRVALEVLTMFEEEQVMEMIQHKGQQMRELAMAAFHDIPYVGEYRQVGLVGAIELVANRQTKEPFASEERIGYHIYQRALAKGLLIRPLGNVLYFMPPYIISEEEMSFMIQTTKETIEQFFQDRGAKVG
ncbi:MULTISPECIES: adenosylmethionine--8-amino-7-oxononanoate transaminase [Lysinibacillus]|uniref:adenosylmethionine--8-amino-7-oxononanoate transaminase n=1 Tax=Lysinibacillus TaxID=400634 RepID=UPI00055A82D4|nr:MULTISPECIES: adenosylmethionine--8-amino-7-oxononanoate transaminase [Lysinibacillus]MEE3806130.1 adenosylmethionine--8-amino-7-oxononanoate transaminase [Lysinibacillus fusiformis]KUF31932.1 adenosylmethionine-8-amino-7-oxononanoate aminotransferase [Lysinibacillus sp. F5]SCZ06751.1 adenosylmethionine-8-amino-7-oxononanoate aminotransferase [Lysinibacillus sp. SG9]SDB52159.1 adenosylmethionine-8-amino-7-oxononanoate aminotransferase [Lysinibacillus sp. TC-37]SFT16386.1 adenosylmethionine-